MIILEKWIYCSSWPQWLLLAFSLYEISSPEGFTWKLETLMREQWLLTAVTKHPALHSFCNNKQGRMKWHRWADRETDICAGVALLKGWCSWEVYRYMHSKICGSCSCIRVLSVFFQPRGDDFNIYAGTCDDEDRPTIYLHHRTLDMPGIYCFVLVWRLLHSTRCRPKAHCNAGPVANLLQFRWKEYCATSFSQ
jgi:hypothetical protein